MFRGLIARGKNVSFQDTKNLIQRNRLYCERRRRKGDGTKTDIFDEKAAANQADYFRKKTAHQLEQLREKLKKEQEGQGKETEEQQKNKAEEDKRKNNKEEPTQKFSIIYSHLNV